MNKILFFLIAFCSVFQLNAQDKNENPSPIIFIYDASGSMWGQMQGKTKMEIAADVLSTSIDSLPDNQKIGFVAYGHRKKGDCKDVEFMVDVENGTKSDINRSIKGIKPLGKTPLAYAAQEVIDKLRKTKLKATIILVTDGIESCGGNICDVIKAAKKEEIDFKLHIIGFGLKDTDTQQLKCAAEAGDGNYYDAADAGGLGDVLDEATTITVDVLDENVSVYTLKNGVAIDALVKAYDIFSKRKPISVRTYKDTAYFFLPPSKYNFEVTPLEGTDVDMITVSNIDSYNDSIIHKTISFDGGKLGVTTTNNGNNWDCIVKLIDQNGKVVASTRTYTTPKEVEVNSGMYKVTIQALGKMEGLNTVTKIDTVKIESGSITPISYDFKTGNFQIYTKVGGENIDAVVTIKEANSGTSVAGSRTYTRGTKFLLNPGTYQVKTVPLGAHKDKKSQTFTIDVKQGELTTKEINF
jgi:Ca-activated chloride channel family protein